MREGGRWAWNAKNRAGKKRSPAHPANEEINYTPDEWEFIKAMDNYKRDNCRPFPTWREVLQVLKRLGYSKANGLLPRGSNNENPNA